MNITINGKEYELATTLRVAYNLETKLKTKIPQIIEDFDNMNLEKLINLLYFGFELKNPDIKKEEFVNMILDSDDFRFVDLQFEVQVFLSLLIDKDNNEEEIRNKIYDAYHTKRKESEALLDESVNDVKEDTSKN